jgi:hypothetical protein
MTKEKNTPTDLPPSEQPDDESLGQYGGLKGLGPKTGRSDEVEGVDPQGKTPSEPKSR